MINLEWTAADLHDINDAIKSGAHRVRKDGREVEFRSLQELKNIREEILRGVNPTVCQTPPARYYAGTRKGTC